MRVSFAQAAERYQALRWPVFPVSVDKAPLTRHGYKDATVSPNQIRMWSELYPDANIAIATGRVSGLIVLDVDGEEGEESLKALAETGIVFPQGPCVRSGRGRHIYMRYDRHMKSSVSRLAPNLDIRADGGSIIAPPSIHASGREYTWAQPPEGALSHFPLNGLLMLYKPRVRVPRPVPQTHSLRELTDRVVGAREGTRNNELNAAAFMAGRLIRDGQASQGEAFQALVQAGMSCGLTKHESELTVRSGLRAGAEP